MKHTYLLGLLFISPASQMLAGSDEALRPKVIYSQTTNLEVFLNEETVKCSDRGYGAKFLKVLIPDLAKLTIFNHRNEGETAPCIAAGVCPLFPEDAGSRPSDLIDPELPSELVDVTVRLEREFVLNREAGICYVSLVEFVEANIRGIPFNHYRAGEVSERPLEDCLL